MEDQTTPAGAETPPPATPGLHVEGAHPGDEVMPVHGIKFFLNATTAKQYLIAAKAQPAEIRFSEHLKRLVRALKLDEGRLAKARSELLISKEPTPALHTIWADGAITFLDGHHRIRAAIDLGRDHYPSFRLPHKVLDSMEVKYFLRTPDDRLKRIPYDQALEFMERARQLCASPFSLPPSS